MSGWLWISPPCSLLLSTGKKILMDFGWHSSVSLLIAEFCGPTVAGVEFQECIFQWCTKWCLRFSQGTKLASKRSCWPSSKETNLPKCPGGGLFCQYCKNLCEVSGESVDLPCLQAVNNIASALWYRTHNHPMDEFVASGLRRRFESEFLMSTFLEREFSFGRF